MSDQTADSLPATPDPTSPASTPSLDGLSEQAKAFYQSRTAPTLDPDTPPPADSAPAAPADPAADTSALPPAPASEPGPPSPSGKPKKNVDSRIQELLADRYERETRIAALEAQLAQRTPPPAPDAPAASSPAPEIVDPSRPVLSEGEYFEQHPEHPYGEYARYLVRHEIASQIAAQQHQVQQQDLARAVSSRVGTFQERYQQAVAADPTFVQAISPTVAALVPVDQLPPGTRLRPDNVVAQEVLLSEHGPAIMLHLSRHPDELTALLRQPFDAIVRSIAKLETRFDGATVSPRSPMSQAPPPPTIVGTKPGVPADEQQAAVASGDFRAYLAARNRAMVKARTG